MRQILVDHARKRDAAKRGGGQTKLSIDDERDQPDCREEANGGMPSPNVGGPQTAEVLAVHDALDRLEAIRPRAAKVAELRFFGGCTIPDTAAALAVSPETVKNDWVFAKAWLQRELKEDD